MKKLISARMGLDISMNFSGVTFLFDYDNGETIEKYFAITPSPESVAPWIQNVAYGRIWSKDNYSIDEMSKVQSAKKLANTINKLITKMQRIYEFSYIDCFMEGSIVNTGRFSKSKARINDLTMFNSIIKLMLVSSPHVRAIGIIPPKSLKKLATGNGNAKKPDMIAHFMKTHAEYETHWIHQYKNGKTKKNAYKIDDVIDAYFLAIVPYEDDKCYVN